MRSLHGFRARGLRLALRGPAVGVVVATALAPAVAPAVAVAAPPAKKAAAPNVERLLAEFAKMPGLYAKFREEKHMALLAAPLVNEGTLHFSRGRLARHTKAPMKSSVVIDADRIQFGDESGREQVELAGNPIVRLFVDSFVKILAGDRTALERIYDMSFTAAGDGSGGWKLVLRPKVDPLDKVIDRMELEGTDLVVAKIVMVEKGGDETVTTFTDVDVNRRYSKAEADRVFRVLGK